MVVLGNHRPAGGQTEFGRQGPGTVEVRVEQRRGDADRQDQGQPRRRNAVFLARAEDRCTGPAEELAVGRSAFLATVLVGAGTPRRSVAAGIEQGSPGVVQLLFHVRPRSEGRFVFDEAAVR